MSIIDTHEQVAQRVEAMRSRGGIQLQPEFEEQQVSLELQRDEMTRLQPPATGKNVGPNERAVSVAAGALLTALGLRRGTFTGLLGAGFGAMLVARGVTGNCAAYRKMGISTAPRPGQQEGTSQEGILISTAVTINKPREELYQFWRNFENLPQFMGSLESVIVIDERRSHWTAKASRLLGATVEWDAEITRDDPNELIAWQSLPGSTIDTAGQVRFQPALGHRGTEVHVWMTYTPPGGRLTHMLAALLGENPKRVVREELHNFRRLMELGEIPTIIGQPRGTCTGHGKRYKESEWKPLFM
jgi:uncharacterized membrane protein